MTGRPRRLTGQRTRAVSLDAETSDAADRMPNFSRFVREAVRAHSDGEERFVLQDIPTARLVAIIHARMSDAADNSHKRNLPNLRRYEALRDASYGWLSITDKETRLNGFDVVMDGTQ